MSDLSITPDTPETGSDDSTHVSILFWIALFTAALIYAAVALSPKIVDWITTRQQFLSNHQRMVGLEQEITYLEQVARTLETDSRFAADVHSHNLVAKADVGTPRALLAAAGKGDDTHRATVPWYAGLAASVAKKSRLRSSLLITAALLTISAFALLNEPAGPAVRRAASGLRSSTLRLLSRYAARPATDDEA